MGRAIPAGELNVADSGGPSKVSAAAEAGYCAPFPTADYKGLMCNWPLAYNAKSDVVSTYKTALAWAREGLKVPVLVAFGEEDLFFDLNAAHAFFHSWLKASPYVEKHPFSRAGHFPMETHPAQVAMAIIDFIRSSEPLRRKQLKW